MSILILKPKNAAVGYDEAAKTFKNLYHKVTDISLKIALDDDGISDLVIIGSDAVNDFLLNEVLELRIGSLGIRYGTDDYCIKTENIFGRKILILAGGRVRSTLYAIYDYFERYANCHYFWDGDIITHNDNLPMDGISVNESPRFEYRGIRYFAHRGLKRFQAEHWSFEDWKKEIDWLVKRRMNFFMLRTGMDDIWQRAFPDDVPYPKEFNRIDAQGYNDRSDFWTMKYRGDLRKKIIEYANALDLMHPADCGTLTHWYSRTPLDFLENKKPTFTTQEIEHYTENDTGKVFDFTKQENMNHYMKLTETMVNEYGESSALFHTVGLGERIMYKDREKNFALKRIAYRRICERLRQKFPNSKLLLASWDFFDKWHTEEVPELIRELDPERTILLDYTSEMTDGDYSFINWGVVGKFPWIFGLFHAYASESELRGPYDRSDARLKIAASDPYCKGMVLWPELSHSDPLVLEYLTNNAWSPLEKSIEQLTEQFCQKRYGKYADDMNDNWQKILPFIKLGDWGTHTQYDRNDDKYIENCPAWHTHQDIWTKILDFVECEEATDCALKEYYRRKTQKTMHLHSDIVTTLKGLSSSQKALENPFILRDSIDITRTVLGRFMNILVMQALSSIGDKNRIIELKTAYLKLMNITADLLSLNNDFSLYHTMQSLIKTAPTNPDFEKTLKNNIYNNYCSQPAYEMIKNIYLFEGESAFDWLINALPNDKPNFTEIRRKIRNLFFSTPLEKMKAESVANADQVIYNCAIAIDGIKELIVY